MSILAQIYIEGGWPLHLLFVLTSIVHIIYVHILLLVPMIRLCNLQSFICKCSHNVSLACFQKISLFKFVILTILLMLNLFLTWN